ncbi:MAG: ATP phosphoribosyltransferase regulatory subunit [Bacillota bacterium]|nr:ATP phosphoribosyltransferase regulatory subunit [Bacillota bacterium]
MKWKIYIPDGVQDLLMEDAYMKRKLENTMITTFRHRGFREIVTPSLEFFDSFSGQKELLAQENMAKTFDAQGRILVLKPDLTVPVARVAATKYKDVRPLKVCYCQSVFRNSKDRYLDLKEFSQAGCEIIGCGEIEADGEIIATAIRSLEEAGLADFTIDLGQVNYFKGLMEASGCSPEEVEHLRLLVNKKDFCALESGVDALGITGDLRTAIVDLPYLYGDVKVLERIAGLDIGATALKAVDDLKRLLADLDKRDCSHRIAIDMGMVSSLHYYTGLIFCGYAPGIGAPILTGGRYDSLVEKFGEPSKATGFSVNISYLMEILQKDGIPAMYREEEAE